MKKRTFWGLFLLMGMGIMACKPDYSKKISENEAALEAHFSESLADSLLSLYKAAVNADPGNHLLDLQLLTKGAALQFDKRSNAVGAVRWLDDAINHHGEGQDLNQAVGLLARVWTAYNYKADQTHSLDPDDIDRMRANLEKSMPWIDSNLVVLAKSMFNAQTGAFDKELSLKYIEVSEAKSNLLLGLNQVNAFVETNLKAAGVAKNIGNPNKALQLYYQVESKYPNHAKAPTALFMTAFIYENDLHDLDKAKTAYEAFLGRYPEDPDYADDAQNSLKTLGKSDLDLIKSFEQKNQVQ